MADPIFVYTGPSMIRTVLPLLALAWLMMLGAAGCDSAPVASDPRDRSLDVVVRDFRFTVGDNGQQRMEVQSTEARIPPDETRALLKDVRIVQLQDGASSGTIEASSGVYFLKDAPEEGRLVQDLVLDGDVAVKRPDGFALTTSKAVIEAARQRLVSQQNSRFTVPLADGRLIEGRANHFELLMDGGFDSVTFKLGFEDAGQWTQGNRSIMTIPR